MNPAQHILLFAVRVYRWTLSPALGALYGPAGGCRFSPTCSVYAAEAVRVHGAVRGTWLATKRVCRCHPWGGHGHDPVPKLEALSPDSRVLPAHLAVKAAKLPH